MSSEYHNLKLDEKSSYFTMFVCQFGRYRYKRLPFGAALAGNMFQRKIDEIFKDMPNVFGIADKLQGTKPIERIMMKHHGVCCRDVEKLI